MYRKQKYTFSFENECFKIIKINFQFLLEVNEFTMRVSKEFTFGIVSTVEMSTYLYFMLSIDISAPNSKFLFLS